MTARTDKGDSDTLVEYLLLARWIKCKPDPRKNDRATHMHRGSTKQNVKARQIGTHRPLVKPPLFSFFLSFFPLSPFHSLILIRNPSLTSLPPISPTEQQMASWPSLTFPLPRLQSHPASSIATNPQLQIQARDRRHCQHHHHRHRRRTRGNAMALYFSPSPTLSGCVHCPPSGHWQSSTLTSYHTIRVQRAQRTGNLSRSARRITERIT